jgi:hypothetical protein
MAHPKFTQEGMSVHFYPHDVEGFRRFYNQLAAMILKDVEGVSPNCLEAKRVPTDPASDCLISSRPIDQKVGAAMAPVNKVLGQINQYSDLPTLKITAHQYIVRGEVENLRKFVAENRSYLGPNRMIRYQGGIDIQQLIKKEQSDNPALQGQLLEAIAEK